MDIFFSELGKIALMLSPIFYKLVYMSLTATCIGLILIIIRKIFDKNISPFWKNAMWVLVLIALLMPYRPQSNLSMTNTIKQVENVSYVEEYNKIDEIGENQTANISQVVIDEKIIVKKQIEAKAITFEFIMPLLWFSGFIVFGIYFMISLFILSKNIMKTKEQNQISHELIFEQCKSLLNIKRNIKLITQSYMKSPAMFKVINPCVILPSYIKEMSDENVTHVILHELSHYKRKDNILNNILIMLQAVYWFNPCVWFIFKFIREDMELANDYYVLSKITEEQKKPYAKSLVVVLAKCNNEKIPAKLLCMVDCKSDIERRIGMFKLNAFFKERKQIIALFCIGIILIVSSLFLTQDKKVVDSSILDYLLSQDTIDQPVQIFSQQEIDGIMFVGLIAKDDLVIATFEKDDNKWVSSKDYIFELGNDGNSIDRCTHYIDENTSYDIIISTNPDLKNIVIRAINDEEQIISVKHDSKYIEELDGQIVFSPSMTVINNLDENGNDVEIYYQDFNENINDESLDNNDDTLFDIDKYISKEGMAKEDVDFLTVEHFALLDKSFKYHEPFIFETGMLPNSNFDGTIPYSELPSHEKDGITYLYYEDSFYSSWDIFHSEYMKIFTEEYFNELNTGYDGTDYYIDVDGDLYYMDVSHATINTYLGSQYDRYELISETEDTIEFNIIAHYFELESEIVTIQRLPVIFNKTVDGWKVAKHSLPW